MKVYFKNLDNVGLLSFLYPNNIIVRDNLPLYYIKKYDGNIITDVDVSTDNKNVIMFSKSSSNKVQKLDDRKYFFKLLKLYGIENVDSIENLDDNDFWKEAKIAYFLKKSTFLKKDKYDENTFNLFKHIFDNFGYNYKLYKNIDASHRIVFSSILTMMSKVLDLKDLKDSISKGYYEVLMSHVNKVDRFKYALTEYLFSNREEIDFLTFLYNLTLKEV